MSNLADQMKADALESQRFSRKHMVLELDFSEASLQQLESNIDTVEFAIRGGKSDENIEMLTRIWGAYLGESIRKQCGGEWAEEEGRIALRCGDVVASPHERVRLRLMEGKQHDLAAYFKEITEKT